MDSTADTPSGSLRDATSSRTPALKASVDWTDAPAHAAHVAPEQHDGSFDPSGAKHFFCDSARLTPPVSNPTCHGAMAVHVAG